MILNKRRAEPVPLARPPPSKVLRTENGSSHFIEIMQSDEDLPMAPPPAPRTATSQPKLLNRNVKILNKQAPHSEPQITFQNVSSGLDDDSMVTEIVFEDNKPDPIAVSDNITNAIPVETHVYPCDQCARSFPLRQLLDLHMANHVRDRKFQCDSCDKAFFSKYDLGKHMLIHSGEKPFKCVVCDKAFSRTTLLRRHEKVHSDQPKFLCQYCERPFLSKEELDKHTANHLKNRPFVCGVCNKGFAFKQGLERHEVVHSTVQPYQCEHCDQSFSTQSKLARHLTAHAGARPYPCRVCPKSFLLSHHLTRHLRSHKELDTSVNYKCLECSEVFETRDDLIYHSAVHATENLTCPLCKEQFDNIDDVTKHIESHTEGDQYACEFCESIFVTEEKLDDHCIEQHSDELAAYDKDDRARESAKSKTAGIKITKEDEHDDGEVLEEYIISDTIFLDENGESIVDKQLVSAEELTKFGADQLEFDLEDEDASLVYEEDEEVIAQPVRIKTEPTQGTSSSLAGQKNIKSYFSPARKVVKEAPVAAVVKAKPIAKPAVAKPAPSPPKRVTAATAVQQKAAPPPRPVAKVIKVEAKSPVKTPANIKAVVETATARPTRRTQVATPPSKTASPKVAVVEAKTSPRLTKVAIATASPATKQKELVNMKIGDRVVKVQQIRVTKSQMEAMVKDGKGGQIVRQKPVTKK